MNLSTLSNGFLFSPWSHTEVVQVVLIVLSTFVFAAPVPRVRAWMPPQRLVGNGWLLARRASYAVQMLRGCNGLNVVVWLFTHF